jgi:hypothetical protein
MEQNSSWKANSRSASQGIQRNLWNQKFHHRVHKSRSMVPILRPINPVHSYEPYVTKANFSIVSRLLSVAFPSGFPAVILYALLISPWGTVPGPSCVPVYESPNNILCKEALHYAVFSSLLSFHAPNFKHSPHHLSPCSATHSVKSIQNKQHYSFAYFNSNF